LIVIALFTRPLLATEHTEFDSGAETLALSIAQQCNLRLAVVVPLLSNPEYEALAPQIVAGAEQIIAGKVAAFRGQPAALNIELNVHIRRGEEPYREIVQEALDTNSDLIVIRRRGKRGFLANLIVGEMVNKVVAHAPCDVLIVPRGAHMWQKCVLVAAEPDLHGRQIVSKAIAVAAKCSLSLHVVTVVQANGQRAHADAFIAEMLSQARRSGITAAGAVRNGKPYAQILEAAIGCQADLIVIGSHGDIPLGRAMVGGVAQKVMGFCEHPVLVLAYGPRMEKGLVDHE
jgi:hypothetical protein